MTKETRERKKSHANHIYKEVKREIDGMQYYYLQCEKCLKVVYPIPQLQKLVDYSKTHQFMFIQDWVLALMYTHPDMPIIGITSFEKQLFLTLMEFAQEHNIPTENPGFRGYKFGPYSERIEDIIIGVEEAGLIKTEGRRGAEGEYFRLTDKGKEIAKKSFDKLTDEQKKQFMEERIDWHQLGTDGLMRYIYKNQKYKEYVKESIVLERILHRRRIGKKVWSEKE
jgi:hypothetical protein